MICIYISFILTLEGIFIDLVVGVFKKKLILFCIWVRLSEWRRKIHLYTG